MSCFQDSRHSFQQLGDYFDTINNDVLEDVSDDDSAVEFFLQLYLPVLKINLNSRQKLTG